MPGKAYTKLSVFVTGKGVIQEWIEEIAKALMDGAEDPLTPAHARMNELVAVMVRSPSEFIRCPFLKSLERSSLLENQRICIIQPLSNFIESIFLPLGDS